MHRLLLLAPLLAAACASAPAAPPPPDRPQMPVEDSCAAAPYARLIGQDATALERELILRPVRVIRPGDAVTMDFLPTRLNFEIDAAGRIARIFCG
ncbi:I78 family peptidase inhibitor [Limimaricola pyoseonensis]|uniref:Peptidase inhibitor I78 family protein n=1 Tax=Limimaricola pyoseonensis TaxID=521013 RepID=A0A1G7EB49_9RHOB|nr:I78 family peptidase inhibitor [Limimaricola pyoseonensis]SDE60873.1 Peptidase inhibitor I78 family protein [Limimaricola pyoseonensis]